MDEIDKNKIEQYMLEHGFRSVNEMLMMFTAARRALWNISGEINDLNDNNFLQGGHETDCYEDESLDS